MAPDSQWRLDLNPTAGRGVGVHAEELQGRETGPEGSSQEESSPPLQRSVEGAPRRWCAWEGVEKSAW